MEKPEDEAQVEIDEKGNHPPMENSHQSLGAHPTEAPLEASQRILSEFLKSGVLNIDPQVQPQLWVKSSPTQKNKDQ